MTASHPQYFIVIDSISPHSNSQLLTAIHCDEPNTGFEPRLISAHFFCPLVWLAVTQDNVGDSKNGDFAIKKSLQGLQAQGKSKQVACVSDDKIRTCGIWGGFDVVSVFFGGRLPFLVAIENLGMLF